MPTTRIALDVMGGDNAPTQVIQGALSACDPELEGSLPTERLLLVGDEEVIRRELEQQGGDPGFSIQHASQVIGMDEKPGKALRAKPDSSIARCIGAVKTGAAGALVSMGNTGAVVGASTIGLGTLAGVRRAGIAVTLELTPGHPVTFLDMGANTSPKPQHLFQYGVMGAVYARDCLGQAAPRVALLNIGQEASKGTELLRESFALLSDSTVDFVGNVESNAIFQNACDIVVTDGFTGNIVLKLLEGFAGFLLHLVEGELEAHKVQWGAEALANVKQRADYSEYGGALLIGVSGVVVIGHGRSGSRAVANALQLAARAFDANVNTDIVTGLEAAAGQERVS